MGAVVIVLSGCASNSANHASGQDTTEDGVTLPPANGGDVQLPPAETGKVEEVKPDALPAVEAQAVPSPNELLKESNQEADKSLSALEVAPTSAVAASPVEAKTDSGAQFKYKVKSGQTLMQVAYDVYGDIHQWRHVLDLNKEKISDPASLKKGTVLVVDQDPKDAADHPEGTAFRIRHGDTLGLISDDVYGTKTKWKRLWDNNKKLIKDPNRIYAGFYLYYLFNEQDRLEKESFQGLQRPAMLTQPATGQRDVSSVPSPTQAQ